MSGRYCVVIPALNAAETIGELIRRIRRRGLAVIVVDDGSQDQTAAVAAREGAFVISHLRNEGKGSALRTGFAYALRERFDGVVTMDGDGQHDPEDIEHLIHAAERQHAGIVVGNRMMNGTVMPPLRRWTNRAMSAIVSLVSRHRIPDSQCGFRLIRGEVLSSLSLRARHFEIETELLLEALQRPQPWKTISVPVQTIYRRQASSIRPVRDGIRFLRVVCRHLRRSR